jgi:hypothetical protein
MNESEDRLKECKLQLKGIDDSLNAVKAEKAKALAEVADIEKKLAEAKRSELRHGDLRHGDLRHWPMASKGHYDGLWSITDTSDSEYGKQVWIDGAGREIKADGNPRIPDSVLMFNLIDDLKAISEDVTEGSHFTFPCDTFSQTDGLDIYLNNGVVAINLTGDLQCHLKGKGLDNYILRLRQMQATLKRKEAKK